MWGTDGDDGQEERGDICKSFHGGADTSTKAYETTPAKIREAQRHHILRYIHEGEEFGRTCEETELALGIPHHTCSARVSELKDEGLIHDSGRRRFTVRRKQARVYRSGPGPASRSRRVGKEEKGLARDLKKVRGFSRDCKSHPGHMWGAPNTNVLKGAAEGCDECLAALMDHIRAIGKRTK